MSLIIHGYLYYSRSNTSGSWRACDIGPLTMPLSPKGISSHTSRTSQTVLVFSKRNLGRACCQVLTIETDAFKWALVTLFVPYDFLRMLWGLCYPALAIHCLIHRAIGGLYIVFAYPSTHQYWWHPCQNGSEQAFSTKSLPSWRALKQKGENQPPPVPMPRVSIGNPLAYWQFESNSPSLLPAPPPWPT